MKKLNFFIFITIFLFSTLANATEITNFVVFGDSLSDRGFSENGGFNRYSNGKVWPEYLAQPLCKNCLEDYAWGGARSDYSNYNGFKWSGVLWQIEKKYKLSTNPDKTLYFIWAGGNDLVGENGDGVKTAKNINTAINKLIKLGAKHIAIMTLPDFTIMAAFNNKKLPEYKRHASMKPELKKQIALYNKTLKSYATQHSEVDLVLLEADDLLAEIAKNYTNILDPWQLSYKYPDADEYMWWDAFHPMTSVHARIANWLAGKLKEKGFELKGS